MSIIVRSMQVATRIFDHLLSTGEQMFSAQRDHGAVVVDIRYFQTGNGLFEHQRNFSNVLRSSCVLDSQPTDAKTTQLSA
jgi:hypothetical protein